MTSTPLFTPTRFRIFYVHQLPGEAYTRDVDSYEQGEEILNVIYDVMLGLFDRKVIPDYANVGGVEYFDPEEGDWLSYEPDDWGADHHMTALEDTFEVSSSDDR